ncbi:tetratricopeptide repeat protein [Hymenobacter sp. B81]|uniref:tetratricopeptide repeat protein n=1 Tax=Hymenobacter sp. B81 TaxID=3344878 RepID=UPI0037DD77D8
MKHWLVLLLLAGGLLPACRDSGRTPTAAEIRAIDLKRGNLALCGPADRQLGSATFATSCGQAVQADFNLGLALLHSFEYDEAEKVFAGIIAREPGCAMAYWGVAMSSYHPLWTPPTPPELTKGARAIALARRLSGKSSREAAYIEALAAFYQDWPSTDHRSRSRRFEQAMARVHADFPQDREAAVFYALALNAAADPADKTYRQQKKAGALLQALYPGQPNHPGIVHYLIHTYDYPELAALGLPAARQYAAVAPSSAHALHMPSHIFTRLGLWSDCIASNLAATTAARCYAESAGIQGHWDEELHGLDYLAYAYLQRGDNRQARDQWRYLDTLQRVEPVNFKVAYALAAVPARYVLENRLWAEATRLPLRSRHLSWEQYPWQAAIVRFARGLGYARLGQPDSARRELAELARLHGVLLAQQDQYKADQVQIQRHAATAWLRLAEGQPAQALALMQQAADLEDRTEKHPVTPGEVLPARELLADMLLELNRPDEALQAYQADLRQHPNRFNGLYGAALAAERAGQPDQARRYYQQLTEVANAPGANRPELAAARAFLAKRRAQAI